MEIYRDFKELLESFNSEKVEYLVVGGHAMVFHRVPGASSDLDIYVRPTTENAQRVLAALDAFGFGKTDLKSQDFEKPDQKIQLGRAPVRIDLITSINGVSWEQAAGGASKGDYGGMPVPFIGRAELIANKKAAGRPQDLVDAEKLEEGPGREP
jgi:hypothetical protein